MSVPFIKPSAAARSQARIIANASSKLANFTDAELLAELVRRDLVLALDCPSCAPDFHSKTTLHELPHTVTNVSETFRVFAADVRP